MKKIVAVCGVEGARKNESQQRWTDREIGRFNMPFTRPSPI